jgi:hypothetical protein
VIFKGPLFKRFVEQRVLSASVRGRSKLEEVALCHPVMPVSDGLSS